MTRYVCPQCGGAMSKRRFHVGPVSIPVPGLSSIVCDVCGFTISATNKFTLTLVVIAVVGLGVLLLAGAVLIAIIVVPPVLIAVAIYLWWIRRKLRKAFRGDDRIVDVTIIDSHDEPPRSLP